jgi:hypothetical protein
VEELSAVHTALMLATCWLAGGLGKRFGLGRKKKKIKSRQSWAFLQKSASKSPPFLVGVSSAIFFGYIPDTFLAMTFFHPNVKILWTIHALGTFLDGEVFFVTMSADSPLRDRPLPSQFRRGEANDDPFPGDIEGAGSQAKVPFKALTYRSR